jgi:hypothetical protein
MRNVIGIFAAAFVAVMHWQAARAQAPVEGFGCPTCRAMAHFRACSQPLDGAKSFVGTVVGVKNGQCSQLLSVEVHRAAEVGLPALAQVDLGYCAFWAGKMGDVIDVAVFETPHSGGNVYTLACRLWGPLKNG